MYLSRSKITFQEILYTHKYIYIKKKQIKLQLIEKSFKHYHEQWSWSQWSNNIKHKEACEMPLQQLYPLSREHVFLT
jgi:hypothetical protein